MCPNSPNISICAWALEFSLSSAGSTLPPRERHIFVCSSYPYGGQSSTYWRSCLAGRRSGSQKHLASAVGLRFSRFRFAARPQAEANR